MIQKAFSLAKTLPENSMLHCNMLCGSKSRIFGKKISNDIYKVSKYAYRELHGAIAYIVDIKAAKSILECYENALCIADFFEQLCWDTNVFYSPIFSSNDLGISNITAERNIKEKNKQVSNKNTNKFLPNRSMFYMLKRNFSKYITCKKLSESFEFNNY